MIREYALDPDIVTSSIQTLARVFSDFGADKGRVIGDFPCRWDREVIRNVKSLNLKTMERKAVVEQLNVLKRQALIKRKDCEINEEDSWIDRSIVLHKNEPFNGILTGEDSDVECVFNYYRMLNPLPDMWNYEQTIQVERKAQELADSIETSLYLSKQIMFIDPYFHPVDDNYKQPFLAFLEKIINGRFNVGRVSLHTCEQNSAKTRKLRADIERGLIDSLKPSLAPGFKVEVTIWPSDKIHDRFVLTDMVGYSFGHGLSETNYQNAINVNINRLGGTVRRELWREYSSKRGSLGDSIIVEGE